MAELLATCSRACVPCISSLVKVTQIQRQGVYIAGILTETLNLGNGIINRKSKASSPIRLAPCVDFTKIKTHFQSFQQNDTQGTIDG